MLAKHSKEEQEDQRKSDILKINILWAVDILSTGKGERLATKTFS